MEHDELGVLTQYDWRRPAVVVDLYGDPLLGLRCFQMMRDFLAEVVTSSWLELVDYDDDRATLRRKIQDAKRACLETHGARSEEILLDSNSTGQRVPELVVLLGSSGISDLRIERSFIEDLAKEFATTYVLLPNWDAQEGPSQQKAAEARLACFTKNRDRVCLVACDLDPAHAATASFIAALIVDQFHGSLDRPGRPLEIPDGKSFLRMWVQGQSLHRRDFSEILARTYTPSLLKSRLLELPRAHGVLPVMGIPSVQESLNDTLMGDAGALEISDFPLARHGFEDEAHLRHASGRLFFRFAQPHLSTTVPRGLDLQDWEAYLRDMRSTRIRSFLPRWRTLVDAVIETSETETVARMQGNLESQLRSTLSFRAVEEHAERLRVDLCNSFEHQIAIPVAPSFQDRIQDLRAAIAHLPDANSLVLRSILLATPCSLVMAAAIREFTPGLVIASAIFLVVIIGVAISSQLRARHRCRELFASAMHVIEGELAQLAAHDLSRALGDSAARLQSVADGWCDQTTGLARHAQDLADSSTISTLSERSAGGWNHWTRLFDRDFSEKLWRHHVPADPTHALEPGFLQAVRDSMLAVLSESQTASSARCFSATFESGIAPWLAGKVLDCRIWKQFCAPDSGDLDPERFHALFGQSVRPCSDMIGQFDESMTQTILASGRLHRVFVAPEVLLRQPLPDCEHRLRAHGEWYYVLTTLRLLPARHDEGV